MQDNAARARKLERSLATTWNAKVIEYDKVRFPFHEWIRERINVMGWAVEDLRELHTVIPSDQVYKVSKQLCSDTNLPEFRKMVHEFIRHEIAPQGELEWPIAVQRFFNVRIMLPNKPQSIFPFHTGLLYGHGPASRSLWMPLTDVTADESITASMQIIGLEKSREMIKHAGEQKMTVDEMGEYFAGESWQCKAGPGSLVFFSQENIHGNFVNVTGKTRVSIDFRLGEGQYGDMLARKIPGGYFKIIPETLAEEEAFVPTDRSKFHNSRSNVLYLNNATAMTYGWPVHLQRYSVVEYCNKLGLNYEFELFELEEMHYMPTLQYIMDNLKCNCVLYSVFALPEDKEFRKRILDARLANGTVMHFTNEDMAITNEADRQRVEDLLAFARFGEK